MLIKSRWDEKSRETAVREKSSGQRKGRWKTRLRETEAEVVPKTEGKVQGLENQSSQEARG